MIEFIGWWVAVLGGILLACLLTYVTYEIVRSLLKRIFAFVPHGRIAYHWYQGFDQRVEIYCFGINMGNRSIGLIGHRVVAQVDEGRDKKVKEALDSLPEAPMEDAVSKDPKAKNPNE